MSKGKQKAAGKSLLEKIGETVGHVKDVMVEKKDELVEAVEEKVRQLFSLEQLSFLHSLSS